MAADPKTSAGARLERKAFREYIRRLIRRYGKPPGYMEDGDSYYGNAVVDANEILAWLLKREARYGPRPGGLGKSAKK